MGGMGVLAVLLVTAVCAAAAPAAGGITTDQLIYQGAAVEMQVDVDGAAAVQLVGDALDAIAAQAKEQGQAIAQTGAGGDKMAMISAGLPLIDPVKEVIKSLQRAAVVVMKPGEKTDSEAVYGYYTKLMGDQGWAPLITVKGPKGERVSVMMAPEAKGLFLMVQEKSELVVGLIITSQPIGQLIGQVVRASGGMVPAIIASRGAPPVQAVAEEGQPAPEGQPQ
jgi:hypothetical protein